MVRSRAVMTFLAVWMIVNVATGLIGFAPGVSDQIAWEAHIGDFFTRFFVIGWFDRRDGPSSLMPRT